MKKILVKLSNSLDELAYSWPFIEKLKEMSPDDKIQVIFDEILTPWFQWPLSGLETFKLSPKDRSLLGVHKFSVRENDIFNVDIFIDLEGSLVSSYMGYCFKAKQRIGIQRSSWAKIFLHHRILPDATLPKDQIFIKILEKLFEKDFQDFSWSYPLSSQEKVSSLFKTLDPRDCHLVILNKLNEETLDFWSQFLNGFNQQKFILVGLEQSFALRDLHQELGPDNEYFYELSFDFERIQELTRLCRGIICDEVWLASLFAAMELRVQYLGSKRVGPFKHINAETGAIQVAGNDPQLACDTVHKNWGL